MTRNTLRVLHLSDFHFRGKTRWDSDPILASLAQSVRELADAGLAPDIVAITGDVACSGRPDEYARAAEWLNTALLKGLPKGFRKSRLLIVPGNHDVDRSAVKTSARAMQDALLSDKSHEKIADVLGDPEERGILLRRHAAYLAFVNEYRTAAKELTVPWWSMTLRAGDARVHFTGLCSSWMSCSDSDHGKLLVGRWQWNALSPRAGREADLRVVLVHHPWAYLADFDAWEIEEQIRREADVVLRGHLHAQRSTTSVDPDNACVQLAAGCVYDGSQYANAYQLVEMLPGKRILRVHYRAWHNGRWIPDRNAYQKARDGVAELPLGKPAARPRTARKPSASADPTRYLQRLLEQTSHISIRGLEVGSGTAVQLPIDRVYIALTTAGPTAHPVEAEQPDLGKQFLRQERPTRVDLRDALKGRCLVVVGDPGAGKSTFLQRLVYDLCRRRLGKDAGDTHLPEEVRHDAVPVFIQLIELADHIANCHSRKVGPPRIDSPRWLAHFAAARCEDVAEGLDEGYFHRLMADGGALVLLDALDDTPSQSDRVALRKIIELASAAYPRSRFVVTTRPAAYVGEAILERWTQAAIAPLDDAAIESFLRRWCQVLYRGVRRHVERHLADLLRPLRERPDLRRLARNPVMLTAMAVVHWNERVLPEQRADLYESIIGWLAKARKARPGRPRPDHCVALVQNLGLAMQDHPKGRQVQVPRYWAARSIAPSFRQLPEDDRTAKAEQFLKEEEVDSGIVVGRGEDEIRFWHLTFQEYLTARALAARSEQIQRRTLLATAKLHEPEWREVFLLLGGVLHHQGIERVDSMFQAVLDRLKPDAKLKHKALCAGLLSAVLRDLSPVGYKPQDPRYRAILEDVTAVFDAKRSRSIPIDAAIEAAEAIGQAGDPRFATPEALAKNWVPIPAGDFLMGAQDKDPSKPNYDEDAFEDESPVHAVTLGAYRIGRYPVTVGEYLRFVEDDGYEDESFWAAGGFGRWPLPEEWDDQLQHRNRPVVRVGWYEAAAYASWVDKTGRWPTCRLPTEAEWERAARGPHARKYPWGEDKPNPRLLNYQDSRIGHPTPVGVYPLGASPEGVLDMAGNVWEWCRDNWHESHKGAPSDGSAWEGGDKSGSRVVRSGSWYITGRSCRSAFRGSLHPEGRSGGIGFRVVCCVVSGVD